MTTKDFQNRGLLRIFLSYFKPHRRLFALDMTCAFLIAVVDLAFPLVSRTALYTWLPEKQFRVFFVVMALVVAAYVLRSGLYFVVAYWGHTFGIRVEADIRRDLYHHMQELGFDFYDKNRTGQLMSRLTSDLFEVTELAHHGPEDLFISLVTIVGALIVMFCIRWELALVLLVMLPVLLPIANGLGLDLVHFGVMIVLNLMIGQVTPPFGVCLFVISDVNKIKLEKLYKSILPFLLPLLATLFLVTYVPQIVTFLPSVLLG